MNGVNRKIKPPKEIWREFMESTKYRNLGETDEEKKLPHPSLEKDYNYNKKIIDLPDPSCLDKRHLSLIEAIEKRKSVRKYLSNPLSLEELSWLLWCTQGVKEIVDRPATLRTVPSAGARHPFETFLIINHVDTLQPGLYRFLASKHKLQEVKIDGSLCEAFAEANWSKQMLRTSAVIFIWVAIGYRMTYRYGNRGYRYMHLDAGHVCQNLYLAALAVDCGVCAVGGFYDDRVNKLLNLDGVENFVIYMATIGKDIISE